MVDLIFGRLVHYFQSCQFELSPVDSRQKRTECLYHSVGNFVGNFPRKIKIINIYIRVLTPMLGCCRCEDRSGLN